MRAWPGFACVRQNSAAKHLRASAHSYISVPLTSYLGACGYVAARNERIVDLGHDLQLLELEQLCSDGGNHVRPVLLLTEPHHDVPHKLHVPKPHQDSCDLGLPCSSWHMRAYARRLACCKPESLSVHWLIVHGCCSECTEPDQGTAAVAQLPHLLDTKQLPSCALAAGRLVSPRASSLSTVVAEQAAPAATSPWGRAARLNLAILMFSTGPNLTICNAA